VTREVIAREFPDVTLEHILVDAFAMHLLLRPADFDVIVTDNMFGDILSDEAAVLAGSIGLLPSASLRLDPRGHVRAGIYEPIHGSAPALAGLDAANPAGAILSAALLLRHSLGLRREAEAIESAVESAFQRGLRTADLADGRPATGTRAFGAEVASLLAPAIETSLAAI
jgi:3-isopropylmalate dehydrogenase